LPNHLKTKDVKIEKLYTVTATEEGDKLVRKLGFFPIKDKSQVPGRKAYAFILDNKGIEQLQEHSRRSI